ncbi:MAG: hypothetical protein KGJ21_03850 [Pseudomonadota bacterium]|nr:hypothetical protein [Pseudomonadota bacterium]
MDRCLRDILETLLLNSEVLGEEILRLGRTEQFSHSAQCFQLIDTIRDSCIESLKTLHTIERRLHARDLLPPCEEGDASKPAEILVLGRS